MHKLREKLRINYLTGHASHVSPSLYNDLTVLWPYFQSNYSFLLDLPRDSRILEIGSGSGSLIAWLAGNRFSNLTGLDISLQEVERANKHGLPLQCVDAHHFLTTSKDGSFDVIIAKAVFEHMTRDEGASLLEQVERVLEKPNGLLILDVPNMDWILASHERYMDLTHETGFTRESMSQILRLYFPRVTVQGSVEKPVSLAGWIRIRLIKPLLVNIVRLFFRILGEGGAHVLFESRSIIAIGRFEAR